jgi:hypothetical protein
LYRHHRKGVSIPLFFLQALRLASQNQETPDENPR